MTSTDVLTFDGTTQPITEWALDYGIYPTVITERLARGWTAKRAVTTPMMVAPRQRLTGEHLPELPPLPAKQRKARTVRVIKHDGKSLTAPEWSAMLGVSIATINHRIRMGIAVVGKAPAPWNRTTFEQDGLRLTATEWAERLGIGETTLRQRIKDGWPLEQALSLGRMSGRAGVVKNFRASEGTGGGSFAQDISEIEIFE